MLDPADVHELSGTQSIDGFRNRKMTTHLESGYLRGDIPMQLALGKHSILVGGSLEPVSMIINTTNRHFTFTSAPAPLDPCPLGSRPFSRTSFTPRSEQRKETALGADSATD